MQVEDQEIGTGEGRAAMADIFSRYCFGYEDESRLSDAIRAYNIWNRPQERCQEMYLGIHWLFFVWCGWSPPSKIEDGATHQFFDYFGNRDFPKTVEGMVEVMEAHIEEQRQEAIEQYEDDPEWGKSYYKGNPAEVHPWGEDMLRAVRAWIYASEFERFCIKHKLKEVAIDHAETHMFNYAIEVETDDIEKMIRDELETAMKTFLKHHVGMK